MKIENVQIKNFCSIFDETLKCDNLTALVGANGTGKSSFLKAIRLFYDSSIRVNIEDFYNRDPNQSISIVITYHNLSIKAKEFFSSYIQEDKLSIEMVIEWNDGKPTARYFGSSLQNPEFSRIRSLDGARARTDAYNILRSSNPEYSALTQIKNQTQLEDAMKQWEASHPEQNVWQKDNGQFFGFSGVGRGYLKKYSQFIYIPAVQDAAAIVSDAKGSPFTTLMDLVVRSVLAGKQEVTQLKTETQEKYKQILNPENHPELKVLSETMTDTLQTFVSDAEIDLEWLGLGNIEIPLPQAKVSLVEDGFGASVEKAGHGLQRAFMMTLFQHLAMAQVRQNAEQAEEDGDEGREEEQETNLIIAIEEPELYQHPSRQRHLARILSRLALNEIPGVAQSTQVIYGTHSSYFVGLDRFNNIRLLRKVSNPNGEELPKVSKISTTDLATIATVLWENEGSKGEVYTEETLLPRLKAIMTPWMNEGFFAKAVILVEGEDDRAIILGVANSLGIDLEANEAAIIPCNGKASIDRPYCIFTKFGIPVYIVWDGDAGRGETEGVCKTCERQLDKKPNPDDNKKLLRLVGATEVEWPACVEADYACFETNLETTLKQEIGQEIFQECLSVCKEKYSISKDKNAQKNPVVIEETIQMARKRGKRSETIESIIGKIQTVLDN